MLEQIYLLCHAKYFVSSLSVSTFASSRGVSIMALVVDAAAPAINTLLWKREKNSWTTV